MSQLDGVQATLQKQKSMAENTATNLADQRRRQGTDATDHVRSETFARTVRGFHNSRPIRLCFSAILVLFAVLAGPTACLSDDRTITSDIAGDALSIDRSITIGDVTVALSQAVGTDERIEIRHSYQAVNADVALYPVGLPDILNDQESIARIDKTVAESGNHFVTTFVWRRNAGDTDTADIYLGSLVVSEPELSGEGQIVLGEEYRSGIATESHYAEVPLSDDISVGDRQYRVTEMALLREQDSPEFTSFILTIRPVNESASVTELASVVGNGVSLTDDAGHSYRWLGTTTRWNHSLESRTVAWQEIKFAGSPQVSGGLLSLGLRGAGVVVGPFVFEDVRLGTENGR